MSPGFDAASCFLAWCAAHPSAPPPVWRMVRDEMADGHADFEHWLAALTWRVEF